MRGNCAFLFQLRNEVARAHAQARGQLEEHLDIGVPSADFQHAEKGKADPGALAELLLRQPFHFSASDQNIAEFLNNFRTVCRHAAKLSHQLP